MTKLKITELYSGDRFKSEGILWTLLSVDDEVEFPPNAEALWRKL